MVEFGPIPPRLVVERTADFAYYTHEFVQLHEAYSMWAGVTKASVNKFRASRVCPIIVRDKKGVVANMHKEDVLRFLHSLQTYEPDALSSLVAEARDSLVTFREFYGGDAVIAITTGEALPEVFDYPERKPTRVLTCTSYRQRMFSVGHAGTLANPKAELYMYDVEEKVFRLVGKKPAAPTPVRSDYSVFYDPALLPAVRPARATTYADALSTHSSLQLVEVPHVTRIPAATLTAASLRDIDDWTTVAPPTPKLRRTKPQFPPVDVAARTARDLFDWSDSGESLVVEDFQLQARITVDVDDNQVSFEAATSGDVVKHLTQMFGRGDFTLRTPDGSPFTETTEITTQAVRLRYARDAASVPIQTVTPTAVARLRAFVVSGDVSSIAAWIRTTDDVDQGITVFDRDGFAIHWPEELSAFIVADDTDPATELAKRILERPLSIAEAVVLRRTPRAVDDQGRYVAARSAKVFAARTWFGRHKATLTFLAAAFARGFVIGAIVVYFSRRRPAEFEPQALTALQGTARRLIGQLSVACSVAVPFLRSSAMGAVVAVDRRTVQRLVTYNDYIEVDNIHNVGDYDNHCKAKKRANNMGPTTQFWMHVAAIRVLLDTRRTFKSVRRSPVMTLAGATVTGPVYTAQAIALALEHFTFVLPDEVNAVLLTLVETRLQCAHHQTDFLTTLREVLNDRVMQTLTDMTGYIIHHVFTEFLGDFFGGWLAGELASRAQRSGYSFAVPLGVTKVDFDTFIYRMRTAFGMGRFKQLVAALPHHNQAMVYRLLMEAVRRAKQPGFAVLGRQVNQSLLQEYYSACRAEMMSAGCLRACAMDSTTDAFLADAAEPRDGHVTFFAALALACGVVFKVTAPLTLGPIVDDIDEVAVDSVEVQACQDERNLVGSEMTNLFDITYQNRTAKAFLMKRNSNREIGLVVPTDIFGTGDKDAIIAEAIKAPSTGGLTVHQNGKHLTPVSVTWLHEGEPLINIGRVRVGTDTHYVGCAVYAVNPRSSQFLNFVNHPCWRIRDVDFYYQSNETVSGSWFEKRVGNSPKTTVSSCAMRLKGMFAETDYAATKMGDCGSPYGFGRKLVTHIHVGVYANHTKALALAIPILRAFVVQYVGDEEIDFSQDVVDMAKWDTSVERTLTIDGKPVLQVKGQPRNVGKVPIVLRTSMFGKEYVYSDDESRNINNLAYARRPVPSRAAQPHVRKWAQLGVEVYRELCAELEQHGFKRLNLHERGYKPFDLLKLSATQGKSKELLTDINVAHCANRAKFPLEDAKRLMQSMVTLRQLAIKLDVYSREEEGPRSHFAKLIIGAINSKVSDEWKALKTPRLMKQYVFAKDEPHTLEKWGKGISRSIVKSTTWYLYMFARSAWAATTPDGDEIITTIDRVIAHLHNNGHEVMGGAFTIGCSPAEINKKLVALNQHAASLGIEWSPVGMDFSGWDRTVPRAVILATFKEMYGSDGEALCRGLCGEGSYDVNGRIVRFTESHNTMWASGLIVTLIANSIWANAFGRMCGMKHIISCGDDLVGVTDKTASQLHEVADSVEMKLKYVEGLPLADGTVRPILFCGVSNSEEIVVDTRKMVTKILANPRWRHNQGKLQAIADVIALDAAIADDKDFLSVVGDALPEIRRLTPGDILHEGIALKLEPVEIQSKRIMRTAANGRQWYSDNDYQIVERDEHHDYDDEYQNYDDEADLASENDDDRQDEINRQREEANDDRRRMEQEVRDRQEAVQFGRHRHDR